MEMRWMPENVRPEIGKKIKKIVDEQCPGKWWEDAVCYVLCHLPAEVQDELLGGDIELKFSFLGGAFKGGRCADRRKMSPPCVIILLQKNLDAGWHNSSALIGLISHELCHIFAKTEAGAFELAKKWGFSYPSQVLLRQKAYNAE